MSCTLLLNSLLEGELEQMQLKPLTVEYILYQSPKQPLHGRIPLLQLPDLSPDFWP